LPKGPRRKAANLEEGSMTSKRGFASMTPERRRQIASMGGKAVKPENRSFSRNRKLATESGRKGGSSVKPENRSFSIDKAFASKCGRKGGKSPKTKGDKDEDSVSAD
jgi:general stress protein YciG